MSALAVPEDTMGDDALGAWCGRKRVGTADLADCGGSLISNCRKSSGRINCGLVPTELIAYGGKVPGNYAPPPSSSAIAASPTRCAAAISDSDGP